MTNTGTALRIQTIDARDRNARRTWRLLQDLQTGLFGSALLAIHRLVALVSHSEQIKGAPSAMNFAAPRIVAGSFFPPVKRLPRRAPPPAGDTAGVGGAADGSGSATSSLAEPGAPRVAPTPTDPYSASARRSLAAAAAEALASRVARSFSRRFLHRGRFSTIQVGWSVWYSACGERKRLRVRSARRHERNAHSCASTASSSFEETGTRRGERSRTHHATDRAVACVQVVRVLGVEVLQLGVRVDGRGGAAARARGVVDTGNLIG